MSEKGGGNLDIFKGLTKGSAAPEDGAPSPQKTLLGLQAPAGAFPPAGRSGPSRPPPSRTSVPPPLPQGRSVPPPPPSTRSGAPPPLGGATVRGLSPPSVAPGSAPGATAKPGGPPAVDMDWDDEDEQTTVYDRGGDADGAQSLLGGSVPPAPLPAAGRAAPSLPPPLASRPGSLPPPMGRTGPSVAPPPRPSMPAPPTRPLNRIPTPPPSIAPPVQGMPMPAPMMNPFERRGPSVLTVGAIAAVVAAVAIALFVLFGPRAGSLVITVSGPGNKPLDAVEIMVNGERKCTSSPCTIEGLKADTYYVRAHAAGYQGMADIAVPVGGGAKAVQNLSLVRALGTGIKVIGEGAGLKLYVDDREVGPLPQEIKDMESGDHTIKVAGSERFEPFEKRITVEPEQMQTIGPLKLRVLKGLATIQPGPGSDGAKVILISGADRRTLPKLPITLDIPTNQPHTLVATRRGFEQLKLPIKFEDGEVEKSFEVALVELGIGSTGGAVAPSGGTGEHHGGGAAVTGGGDLATSLGAAHAATGSGTSIAPSTDTSGGSAAGSAMLNINSIPVSNILLDGRPVGQTPKMGVHVSPGAHTVTFVKGSDRKVSPVTVGAGQTKTVAMRF